MGPLYNVHQTTNKAVTQRKWQNWNHSFYESKYSIEYPPKENIILIIVESLLSFPTDLKINGIEITPTLNKLVEKGAYYNNNMTSLIQLGRIERRTIHIPQRTYTQNKRCYHLRLF